MVSFILVILVVSSFSSYFSILVCCMPSLAYDDVDDDTVTRYAVLAE
jgi:hypothetical protein